MRYPIVLQHSEEDCGAACIATIAKHHGRTFAISRIREAVGAGSRGTTLLGLNRGAEAFGFNARQVNATNQMIARLSEALLQAIVLWKDYHWVVLYGKREENLDNESPNYITTLFANSVFTDAAGNPLLPIHF